MYIVNHQDNLWQFKIKFWPTPYLAMDEYMFMYIYSNFDKFDTHGLYRLYEVR